MFDKNNDWKNTPRRNIEEILDLATLCSSSAVFHWNGKYYEQVYGTWMGRIIPVVLAEITLQSIETQIFNQKQDDIFIWKRYVDDILAIIPKKNVNTFLDYINSLNFNIQFTTEVEENHYFL